MDYEKFGKTIYFFTNFNDDIDEKILKKLNSIKFIEFVNYNDMYDKQISYSYQSTDKKNKFNKPIDNLPPHIKSLILGYSFNKIVNIYPEKLKELIYGYLYNQEVNNLPENLVKLIFGYSFNKPVDNLPNKIKILSFGLCFSQAIDYLPSSITHLEIGSCVTNSLENLPSTIKYIVFMKDVDYTNNLVKLYPNTKFKSLCVHSEKNYYYDKKIYL